MVRTVTVCLPLDAGGEVGTHFMRVYRLSEYSFDVDFLENHDGASVDAIQNKLEAELWPTWVNSVIVWGPVQIGQQMLVPLKYRVAVANGVSYVWDTYLSLKMMPPPAEAGTEKASKPSALVRRRTIV